MIGKKQSSAAYEEKDLDIGDKIALSVSRLMSTWWFIDGLALANYQIITNYSILSNVHPLDVFNLCVSLYTLFVDLIILRSAISQRNMDRALAEKMQRMLAKIFNLEETLLKTQQEQSAAIIELHRKIDRLTVLTEKGNAVVKRHIDRQKRS